MQSSCDVTSSPPSYIDVIDELRFCCIALLRLTRATEKEWQGSMAEYEHPQGVHIWLQLMRVNLKWWKLVRGAGGRDFTRDDDYN